MIDYCPEYTSLKSHNNITQNDLLYIATLNIEGKLDTHVVQVLNLRQEYNPFYTRGKGEKFYPPEYEIAIISYKYKTILHKFFNKKTLVLKETLWIDNVFLRNTEIDAKAALLSCIREEKIEKAKTIFKVEHPNYLETFKSKETRNCTCGTHKVIEYFIKKEEEEYKNIVKKNIFDKIPEE